MENKPQYEWEDFADQLRNREKILFSLYLISLTVDYVIDKSFNNATSVTLVFLILSLVNFYYGWYQTNRVMKQH